MNIDINKEEIKEKLNINKDEKVYFEEEDKDPKVFEVVNYILTPQGYESFSKGQFKRIAGGSSNSSNRIKNYAEGRGRIKHGFTYLDDILDYCSEVFNNSVLIPLEDVVSEFEWAKEAVNGGYVTLYSSGKNRYDIEAMMDFTKGLLVEDAFRIDCDKNGIEITLNREFYEGKSNTDEGQDIEEVKFKEDGEFWTPNIKVQIKDAQYFILIPKDEFEGKRKAELFISYKIHWAKERTGQQFFRTFGDRGEEIFSDFPPLEYVIAERRGWALRKDFSELSPGKRYKGLNFSNDNMFVYWDDLRDMEDLFLKLKSILKRDTDI